MKVSELTGARLDYWVGKAANFDVTIIGTECCTVNGPYLSGRYSPSTDWSQGGPIIEREKITINPEWFAGNWDETVWMPGETILIAAMRCFVASKYGDGVPDES